MNNRTAIVILLVATIAILIVWYRQVGRLRCSYNGPTDSFAIYNKNICKCKYPNQFAKRLRRVRSDECLTIKDGVLVNCDEPQPTECESSLFFARDGNIGICRGANVKPYFVDGKRLGLTINANGDIEPIIDCIGTNLPRDARVWFNEPACVNSRIIHQPINLIQSRDL